jgi:hypothetical protein
MSSLSNIYQNDVHTPYSHISLIIVGPFMKWGVDFMTCHLTSYRGHRYIIVAVDYFTKWEKSMLTFTDDGETTTLFVVNQVIARFRVPKEIVTDYENHF